MAEEKKSFVVGRRTFVAGSLAASAIAALAGCKKENETPAAANGGGTLRYYLNNPVCIEPFNVQEDQGTQVSYQLFDTLTNFDYATGKLVPLAAESWEASQDGTEFTFKLVKGAKFHNGDAVDAASFKRSWDRLVDPKTTSEPSEVSYHLALVEGYDQLIKGEAKELSGVTVVDENTLKVKLTASYADFPYVAAHPALAPVPKAALDDFDTFFRAPIGNGPFKMSGKWEDGQQIKLVRNDDYYGDKALLESVEFNIFKDPETAYREFQGGNLEIAHVPSDQIEQAIKEYGKSEDGYTLVPGKQVSLGEQLSTYYMVLNTKDEVLKDPELRHALSLAINRQAICDVIFSGTREPADNIVPPSLKGYEKGAWKYSKYDKAAAEAILDKKYPKGADGKRNINIKVLYNLDGSHEKIMLSVIADWEAVGITATSETAEWATVLTRFAEGSYQAGRLGWIADYPVLDNFLYPLFKSGSGDNKSQLADPAVDKLLEDGRTTVNEDERIAKLQEANRQIAEICPVIPLMFYKLGLVSSANVKKVRIEPDGKSDLSKAELNA